MDQIHQCMDNKEPSRVKFRRAEPDPPLLAVRLGSARLEYQFASVWRITDRTRAPTTKKSVHSVVTTVGQTLRTTRSAKAATFFEKTHVCNWASKIRRCMVNNQRVRLASQARELDSQVYGALKTLHDYEVVGFQIVPRTITAICYRLPLCSTFSLSK
ncbi:hypothetical protein J6590_028257 [Homalodisca vitripennis]|nr:hypothetical protein J6590_028257 [Homalodisca vitripennis]